MPYQGPNGTRRRPIYIECRQSGIIIQPEGIVFGPQDFNGSVGARETRWTPPCGRFASTGRGLEGDAAQGEPYPLLIVRPDGAVAYSMARAAMAGWDDEFGYELVDDETELAFPPGDPESETAAAKHDPDRTGTASDPGGRHAQPLRHALAHQLLGAARRGLGRDGGALRRPAPAGGRASGASALGSGESGGDAATGYGGGGRRAAAASRRAGNRRARPPDRPPGASDTAAGQTTARTARQSGGAGRRIAAGRQRRRQRRGGRPVRPAKAGGAAPPSMALTKGPNWALPDSTATATGITRPITVHCYPDRLVIMPDRRDARDPQTVALDGADSRLDGRPLYPQFGPTWNVGGWPSPAAIGSRRSK